MGTNIEWKAHARDPDRQRELAERLTGRPPELLEQLDTFFPVPRGRLKLRQLAPDHGELIYYERPDQAGPKPSNYSITRTAEPAALREVLGQSLGVRGEVRKRRWLSLVGQSRIHLDEVEGLGTFLEVEVVLQPGQSVGEAQRIALELRRALDVRDEDLIQGAYLDLLGRGADGGQ
jgi:predicted adenylyl cyclase CyaB